MADPAKRRLRRKIDRLALALDGSLAEHQRLLLRMHTRRLEEIGRGLAEVEAAIVAEIGADMAVFGTAQRLAAWAGLCPANHESAARQTPRGTRKGNPYFEATLVTAAVCGARTKGSYLRDKLPSFRPSKCTNAHQNGILGSRGQVSARAYVAVRERRRVRRPHPPWEPARWSNPGACRRPSGGFG